MKYRLKTVTWKFRDVRESHPDLQLKKNTAITSPDDAFKFFRSLFKDRVKELFVVVWLNNANKVTGFEIISEGNLSSSIVHPREVFRGAIVETAASIILAHNHPSDNPEPSNEDKMITRQLVEAGKIIGITVHDHLIFTNTTYLSFAERGLL